MKKKSHSGLKKRVKVTAKGKLIFDKSAKKHLLTNKSKRQKGVHPSGKVAHPSDSKYLNKLLAK